MKIIEEIMRLLARIFGKYTLGVDFASSSDKTVRVDAYIFQGKTYITKIKEITKEEELNDVS